jgi:hypothetical protein
MIEYRVNVLDLEGDVVGRVRYNQNLDYWDGRNWTCGSTGRHEGITKLKDGQYVIIHGTQWQGERDTAEIITPEEALNKILKSGNSDLLKLTKFQGLNGIFTEMDSSEEE